MAARKTSAAAETAVATKEATVEVESPYKEDNTPIIPKQVDMSQYITVRNGFQGGLVFKNPKTGETFRWNEFGDEQDIELRDLKGMKSYAKTYFENNWFMFDKENHWVIDFLGLNQYYKFAIQLDDFDSLFDKPADEIKKTISKLSAGQKKSVAYRARQLVVEDKIDSRSAIRVLEDALGVELIEK